MASTLKRGEKKRKDEKAAALSAAASQTVSLHGNMTEKEGASVRDDRDASHRAAKIFSSFPPFSPSSLGGDENDEVAHEKERVAGPKVKALEERVRELSDQLRQATDAAKLEKRRAVMTNVLLTEALRREKESEEKLRETKRALVMTRVLLQGANQQLSARMATPSSSSAPASETTITTTAKGTVRYARDMIPFLRGFFRSLAELIDIDDPTGTFQECVRVSATLTDDGANAHLVERHSMFGLALHVFKSVVDAMTQDRTQSRQQKTALKQRIQTLKQDKATLTRDNEVLTERIRGGIDMYETVVRMNEALTAKYDQLVVYSKETDALFNAAMQDLEQAREAITRKDEYIGEIEKEMSQAEKIIDNQAIRLGWKNKADLPLFAVDDDDDDDYGENGRLRQYRQGPAARMSNDQIYAKDNRAMAQILEDLRLEKERYQSRALRSSKSVGNLSALVSNLRNENAKFRTELIAARRKIPKPGTLIMVREVGESIDEEIAAERRRIQDEKGGIGADASTTEAVLSCKRCAIMWMSTQHWMREVETSGWKITALSENYVKKIEECEARAERRIEEGTAEARQLQQQMEQLQGRHSVEIQRLEQELERARLVTERKIQAKDKECARLVAEAAKMDAREEEHACGTLALQALTSTIGAFLSSSSSSSSGVSSPMDPDVKFLSDLATLVGEINVIRYSASNTSAEEREENAQCMFGELARLMTTIIDSDDGSRQGQEQQQLMRATKRLVLLDRDAAPKSNNADSYGHIHIEDMVPYSVTDDARWHEMVVATKDLLPLCVDLAMGISGGGKWRAQIDYEALRTRADALQRAVSSAMSAIANDNLGGDNISVIRAVYGALFDPLECGMPFIAWVVGHAVSCMGVNEHFANAMRKTLDAARAQNTEVCAVNQRLISSMETKIGELIGAWQLDTSRPLYAEDAQMLKSLAECAQEGTNMLRPYFEDASFPRQAKEGINQLQMAWAFVYRMCNSMHMQSYYERQQQEKEEEQQGPPKRGRRRDKDDDDDDEYNLALHSPIYTPLE